MVAYEWRGPFDTDDVETLHAEGFERDPDFSWDWRQQVERHSLGWVCARAEASRLVGWVSGYTWTLTSTCAPSTSTRVPLPQPMLA